MYEFNDSISSMRVGERSLHYAMSNGVSFTEEEFSAILNFEKNDDKMAEYHNSTVGDLLKTAALFAVKNEKIKK